ncbi:histidine kinase [Microbacterium lacus]|uniref:sensor histidine kinase n=1 Tax=Microbacterium lacus TaxID=415217 RepID=UPI003850E7B6
MPRSGRVWHARCIRFEEVTIACIAESSSTPAAVEPSARMRMPAWVSDVLLGLPVALGALATMPFADASQNQSPWAGLAVGIAVAAALPLARRFPRTLLAVTTLIAAAAPLWSTANLGLVLACAICLYRLAAVTADRRVVLFALLASAGLLVASVALFGPEDRYVAWMLQPVAVLVGAAALGEATRSRRAYIDAITERAERAERTRELEAERRVTEERLRIARDLHDAAGHQMAAINLNAGVAKNALPNDPERATALLTSIQHSARIVLDEIGALLHLLRGVADDGEALAPVATWANIPLVVESFRSTGLEVTADLATDIDGLRGAADVVAYKVMQEGLANALKHGDGAATASARVVDGGLVLRVENLVGTSLASAPSGRYGLIGMRERVEPVEGSVHARREARRDGTAFVLEVLIPLPPEEGST